MSSAAPPPRERSRSPLAEVALVFGRLGLTAFGGPAAHLALQEEEIVRRRSWLDRQRFLDLLAATNLIPGPNSTEMALHLGRVRAGWPGMIVGGAAFIGPAAVLSAMLAWAYVRWGRLPEVVGVLDAVRPAVLVVIADAVVRFARTSIRGPVTAAIAGLGAALALAGFPEVSLVFIVAAAGLAVSTFAPSARLRSVPLAELAWVFVKIGATLFGSGYVLVAYLRAEVIGRGWLTDGQLLDAVAAGQITPGPVSSTATFVGYLLAGTSGAVVATLAMFLPSFVFVAATGPLVERWRDRPAVRSALDLVNATVTGLIVAVVLRLAPVAVLGPFQLAVAALAAVALWGFGIPGTVVMLAATAAGLARALAGGIS